ncbi:tryptophan synthase beta subunit-like PLP-dependent enzyme [Serendipita vermifera]|nr:tryptophan synthase beta subunit-like PLP-dependent enzyme [Serendipita vermifera]
MSPSILPHLVIASGGNAGLAAASAARLLGLQCTIFVPDAQANIVHMFERHGTNGSIKVRVGGVNYYEALTAAKAFKDQLGERGILVPAYDDPLVWQGNSTLMHEIAQQLPEGVKPDAIFCSVGGGGLIAGLMLGCEMIPGWSKVPIVGVETSGSACFYHSAQCSRNAANEANLPKGARSTPTIVRNPFEGFATPNGLKQNGLGDSQPHVNGSKDSTVAVVHLAGIESRASSLGASSPSPDAVAMALRREGPVRCVTISDQRAMRSALEFVDDHFVVPELACSATLVPAYTPRLLERLVPRRAEGAYGEDGQRGKRVLVFVVCGGSKSSVRDLREFEAVLRDGPYAEEEDAIWVDGERV